MKNVNVKVLSHVWRCWHHSIFPTWKELSSKTPPTITNFQSLERYISLRNVDRMQSHGFSAVAHDISVTHFLFSRALYHSTDLTRDFRWFMPQIECQISFFCSSNTLNQKKQASGRDSIAAVVRSMHDFRHLHSYFTHARWLNLMPFYPQGQSKLSIMLEWFSICTAQA